MSEAKTMDANGAPLKHPAGLWVLIFTETFERFSHYGMRALLILYLTAPMAMGGLGLAKPRAAAIFGGYLLAIYLFGLSGGQIADRFLGTKRTILIGGLFIAAGQLLLQVRTLDGLILSLVLISVGTCLLKPNISASVGRLYTKEDSRRDGAFTFEYMGINIGATAAPIICAFMVDHPLFHRFLNWMGLDSSAGWAWAFGVSGVGMLLALVNFLLRRRLIVDVTIPEGEKEPEPKGYAFVAVLIPVLLVMAWMVIASEQWYVQLLAGAVASFGAMLGVQYLIKKGFVQTRATSQVAAGTVEHHQLSKEDIARLSVVGMMLCFSLTFWFVFQQAGSSLNLFARDFTDRTILGMTIPTGWFQTVNAILIVGLSPLFAWIWTRRSGLWPSSPQKFALALLFAALGFLLLVPASQIVQSVPGTVTKVGMGWLLGVYLLHTIGELCLSPVGLSYVSKLAPKHLGGQLMGAWFFATGCGSYLAGKAAGFMDSVPLWQLFGFCALIAITASLVLYFIVSRVIFKLMGGHS